MPAKKNARKRTRDRTNDTSGPPKKRAKKVSKPMTDSLRRSTRTHKDPSEWWKTTTNSPSSSSDESDSSQHTYLPPIRRSTRASPVKPNNKKPKNKNPKSKTKIKLQTRNNKTQNKNKNKNKNTKSDKEEKEEYTRDTHSDSDHSALQTHNNSSFNLLSPHRKHTTRALPKPISVQSTVDISDLNLSGLTGENECISKIKNALKQSEKLSKSQCELSTQLRTQLSELCKPSKEREILNANIRNINDKYVASHKLLDTSMGQILDKINGICDEQQMSEECIEAKYKILYETSQKKIKLINAEMSGVNEELRVCKSENASLKKEMQNLKICSENERVKCVTELRHKYSIEIDDLKLELHCQTNAFNEYKAQINERDMIARNNTQLLCDNLKRENAVLIRELEQFNAYNSNNRTQSPTNGMQTPNLSYNNYRKHIRESPINERDKTELISISNVKELENKIRTMEGEMDLVRKQLCAKKELIGEFQQILSKNTEKQKEILSERGRDQKVISLYQILTCTKIETGESESEYKCRIVNRGREAMLEYTLTLNGGDTNTDMPVFIDYCLLAHKNLGNVLSEGLDTKDGTVTFCAKDAPLFLKGLIQQIFM